LLEGILLEGMYKYIFECITASGVRNYRREDNGYGRRAFIYTTLNQFFAWSDERHINLRLCIENKLEL
jgi:hypothetical protein